MATFEAMRDEILVLFGTIHGDERDDLHTNLLRRVGHLDPTAVSNMIALIATHLSKQFSVEAAVSKAIARHIYEETYGLGAISELWRDASIGEIWCNRPDNIWIERNGFRSRCEGLGYQTAQDVLRVIQLMLRFDQKEISVTQPIAEARLADGTRLTSMIPPASAFPSFTLRRPNAFMPTTQNMLDARTMDDKLAELLRILVRGRANILVIGGTGAGKTQLLRWLLGFVRPDFCIFTFETQFELCLNELYPHLNIDACEECTHVGATMGTLFRTALRRSPDNIVCGEMRSYEAKYVVRSMRRDHPGSMSTLHSSEPEFVIDDVADMIFDDGESRDANQLRDSIAQAVDIIIQINRSDKTGKRQVTRVCELNGKEVHDLSTYDEATDTFMRTGQIRNTRLQSKLRRYAPQGPDPISTDAVEALCYAF